MGQPQSGRLVGVSEGSPDGICGKSDLGKKARKKTPDACNDPVGEREGPGYLAIDDCLV